MNKKRKLKDIWTEGEISEQLFIITAIITVITMAMLLTSFFSNGKFAPSSIDLLYLGILIIYALHKEALRWMKEPGHSFRRKGELFVYIWIFFTTGLYIVDFLNPGKYSSETFANPVLQDVTLLSLEIFAIFIFTRGLKFVQGFYRK